MAAKKATATADRDEMVSEIHDTIDRIKTLMGEGKPEAAGELSAEAEIMITRLSGSGSVALRQSLRDQVRGALDTKSDDTSAEVEVSKPAMPENISDIEGLEDLVNIGATKVRQVTENKIKGGRAIAEILLDIRRRIILADGMPDLSAKSHVAKKASAEIYDRVTASLPAAGESDLADSIRDEITSVKRSAQTAMVDVRVEYALALDSTDDEEELAPFAGIIAEGEKPSEAIARHYGFPLKTRREIEQERRDAKKAIEASAEEEVEEVAGTDTTPAETQLEDLTDEDIKAMTPAVRETMRTTVSAKIEALTKLLERLA